jgi:hypothetical protein
MSASRGIIATVGPASVAVFGASATATGIATVVVAAGAAARWAWLATGFTATSLAGTLRRNRPITLGRIRSTMKQNACPRVFRSRTRSLGGKFGAVLANI